MNIYKPFIKNPDDISILNIVGTDPCWDDRVINDREKLKWILGVFKREGIRVVYTSGVYDLFHDGHAKYLAEAKKLGGVLVVGVDNDELTRQRKPDERNRPIDTLNVRLTTLVHNRSVNILTVRSPNEHPDQLIYDILPDVAVFSRSTKDTSDFENKIRTNLKDYCGEIVFLEPQSSNSTTSKIRRLATNGANELAQFLRLKLNGKVDQAELEGLIQDFFMQKEGGRL